VMLSGGELPADLAAKLPFVITAVLAESSGDGFPPTRE